MNIEPFAKIVITAIHHIAIWLKVHQPQHFVAVVANHLAVAPCYGSRQKRGYLNVGQR